MSLRQKYLKILSGMASGGAVGLSVLLGSAHPGGAVQDAVQAQPRASEQTRISERLAAVREAVSDVARSGAGVAAAPEQQAWWANGGWRNGGGGWRNGGVWRNAGVGWRNGGGGWRNGGWRNFWRNW
jgi:hypothetical protein